MTHSVDEVGTQLTIVEISPDWGIIIPAALAAAGLMLLVLIAFQLRKRRE